MTATIVCKRWEILKKIIDQSLHQMSTTRWSAKLKAVTPFKNNIPSLVRCLQECESLKLTPKAKSELQGAIRYLESFECILMACIWLHVLQPIDACNNAIQARDSTLDVEASNLDNCMTNLNSIGQEWPEIVTEAANIAKTMNIDAELPIKRNDSNSTDKERLSHFETNVLQKILNTVKRGIEKHFVAIQDIMNLFDFLWTYLNTSSEVLIEKCNKFSDVYAADVSKGELFEELMSLKMIHQANFGNSCLAPLNLLNKLTQMNLEPLYPYVSIALRIFLTLPVTVATAERSFSKLKLIKNYLRSTMGQERLQGLAILAIETDLARKIDFDEVIDTFATEKARRAPL